MEVGGKVELVERLGRLREEGALTDAEFARAKASVLDHTTAASQSAGSDDETPLLSHLASAGPKLLALVVAIIVVAGAFYLLSHSTQDGGAVATSETAATAPLGSSTAAAEADAALQNVEAAVAAASDAVNEVAATDAPATDSSNIEELPGQRTVLSTKPARCRVHVPTQEALVGPCTYKAFSDTEFEVSAPSDNFAVQVVFEGTRVHGITVNSDGTTVDVGPLMQKGACWNNAEAEICAWAVE
jgi:hypothetical protein